MTNTLHCGWWLISNLFISPRNGKDAVSSWTRGQRHTHESRESSYSRRVSGGLFTLTTSWYLEYTARRSGVIVDVTDVLYGASNDVMTNRSRSLSLRSTMPAARKKQKQELYWRQRCFSTNQNKPRFSGISDRESSPVFHETNYEFVIKQTRA